MLFHYYFFVKKIICKNIDKNLGHELYESSLILLYCSRDFLKKKFSAEKTIFTLNF